MKPVGVFVQFIKGLEQENDKRRKEVREFEGRFRMLKCMFHLTVMEDSFCVNCYYLIEMEQVCYIFLIDSREGMLFVERLAFIS